MIIRGGENIFPVEVENVLHGLDPVINAAIVGLPDDLYGEIVGAFVQLNDGDEATVAQLDSHLRTVLAGCKVPSKWFLVNEYPLTPSGKIQKHKLREGWLSGDYKESIVTGSKHFG
jgi:fatty-acyl-CoA synthase